MFAAGRANTPASTPNYVEEVFSSYTYTGNGGSQAITNGIALSSTAEWKTRTLLDGTSTYLYKVKKDTAGNYIVSGNSIVSGIYRVLVIKFDSSWNILWQKRISQDSTSQTATSAGLALDSSNNIYVAFGIEGAAASLVKLNSSGDLQWNRVIEPSTGSGRYLNTVIYNTVDGFLYVGGRTSGPGGPGLYAKYSTAGTLQWMYKFKPPGTYYGNQQYGQVDSMAHDSAGNVYFCGSEFDSGWKGHVVKINSSGTFQWNKRISGTTSGVNSIFIDSSDGVYVGYWDGAVFSSSSYVYTDLHTTKLNSSTGAIIWDRKVVGYPSGPGIPTITGDSSGGIYTTLGAQIIKHNSSGTFQWSRRLYSGLFYGVSAIDSTLYATGFGTSNGFITELATDGSTTSGTAYHTISADVTDSAGSQTISTGTSEVEAHTGPEQAGTATVSTASTALTVYSQAAVIGQGGLVWTKARSTTTTHRLWDTTGRVGVLSSDSSNAQNESGAYPTYVSGNADGFRTSSVIAGINASSVTYSSWTFRKQPKFFDIVTFIATTGKDQRIPHSLGSVPGCIMIKPLNTSSGWYVYHRSLSGVGASAYQNFLSLESTAAASSSALTNRYWGSANPTSTDFGVSDELLYDGGTDASRTYVAYIFAHDAGGFGLTGADNIITCDSFTTDGSGNATVTLGYEPQWFMYKGETALGGNYDGSWRISDTMRGWPAPDASNVYGVGQNLSANNSDAESGSGINGWPTSTGFAIGQLQANKKYIYMAIRKGPMKVPTVGTSVFIPIARNGTGAIATITGGFAPDLAIAAYRTAGEYMPLVDKLRGPTRWLTWQQLITQAESNSYNGEWFTAFTPTGMTVGADNSGGKSVNASGSNTSLHYYFKRAPKFFDAVAYSGNDNVRNITHNLGAPPELIITKQRNGANSWLTYVSSLPTKYFVLSSTSAASDYQIISATSATTYTVGTDGAMNGSGNTFIAYLFATCPGVSKVGSYTGTGAALEIDCGFTSGARFVFLKRTDGTGPWYMWDTARGIVAGNDPFISTSQAAETTNTDYIDPYSAGFAVTADSATVNASGGNYIFLAIA